MNKKKGQKYPKNENSGVESRKQSHTAWTIKFVHGERPRGNGPGAVPPNSNIEGRGNGPTIRGNGPSPQYYY